MIGRIALGMLLTVAICIVTYLAWAFVNADLYWLADVMKWSRYDRFMLLYTVVMVSMIGFPSALYLTRRKS